MRRAVLPFVALLALAAPGLPGAAQTQTKKDPVRVAVLLPYIEEALRGIPGVQVVAGVRTAVDTSPRAGLADLGSSHAPNLENLAAARADLVVADRRLHQPLVPKMKAVAREVVLVDGGSVESTLAGIESVGRKSGAAATAVVRRVKETRAELERRKLARPVPTLVLFGAPGSFLAVTERTWLGDLLGQLGFRNVVTDSLAAAPAAYPGYVELSDELIATLRPELILVVAHGDPAEVERGFRRRIQDGGAWAGLGRARYGLKVLDPALFSANPGLRMDEAAKRLAGLIPESAR